MKLTVVVAVLIGIVDQVTKHLVNDFFSTHLSSVPVIPDIFHLSYVKNTGIAFGLFREYPTLLLGIIIMSVIVMLYYACTSARTHWFVYSAYGAILGGAIGNLIDRIHVGYVIDFLDFRIWPVFNVADIAISMGVGILLIDMLFLQKTK